MAIRIVQLGSPREMDEGLRVGTVRRPPRGVPRSEYARRDFYDVWLPNLSPSPELMKEGKSAQDDKSWALFRKKFRAEMGRPEARRVLELLAALSHQTQLSVGTLIFLHTEDYIPGWISPGSTSSSTLRRTR